MLRSLITGSHIDINHQAEWVSFPLVFVHNMIIFVFINYTDSTLMLLQYAHSKICCRQQKKNLDKYMERVNIYQMNFNEDKCTLCLQCVHGRGTSLKTRESILDALVSSSLQYDQTIKKANKIVTFIFEDKDVMLMLYQKGTRKISPTMPCAQTVSSCQKKR